MNRLRVLLILYCSLAVASCRAQAASQPDSLPSIAVMDFEGRNMTAVDAASLADRFRFELMKTKRFDVMERNEMTIILQEQEFQKTDCVDQSCAVEAGRLIAVRKIVTGTVAKVGGIYTLNVKMLDVETGRIDQNLSEDCDCPIEKVLTETIKRLGRSLAGLEVSEAATAIAIQRGDASLFIKTEPPDASVYLDGRLMDARTPCTFENLTAGKHTVMARKADLQGVTAVDLTGNQVARIALSLGKQQTILRVMSEPSEAEAYLDRGPGKSVRPGQLTPAIFEGIKPGAHNVTLFKVGYRDTTFAVELVPNQENPVSVKLSETSADRIKAQKKMVRDRKQRFAGRFFIAGSLALAAAGGVVYYLGVRDYNDALDARDFMDQSVVKAGPQYETKEKENKDKTASSKLKRGIGTGLLGVGGAGLAVGVVLWF